MGLHVKGFAEETILYIMQLLSTTHQTRHITSVQNAELVSRSLGGW
jgi:hypothetical protein